jgi:tetratricopeptide (TPR) repeat protein
MLARQRQYAEAERLLREVIESASEYQPARLALGRLLAEQGRIGEAEQALLFAARDPRYEVPARLALARVLSHGGEHAGAIRNAQIAVASRPDAEGFAVLALAFVGTAQWENAELAVHRALEADPRACSAHLATAQLVKARGQNEQALVAAEQAVKLNPYSVEALALAGRICLELDRPKQCVEFWAKALKLNSWDLQLHWDLADLYRLRLNERASAIEHYRRYIELKGPKAKEAQELIDQLQAAASPG